MSDIPLELPTHTSFETELTDKGTEFVDPIRYIAVGDQAVAATIAENNVFRLHPKIDEDRLQQINDARIREGLDPISTPTAKERMAHSRSGIPINIVLARILGSL